MERGFCSFDRVLLLRVGALLWAHNDGKIVSLFAGEPKPEHAEREQAVRSPNPTPHLYTTDHPSRGVPQVKDQIARIEMDIADIKASVERGAISVALRDRYSR